MRVKRYQELNLWGAKMNKKILLVFLVSVLMLSNVLALGVSPGRTTFDFKPGLERTIDVIVINSDHLDAEIRTEIKGELGEYVSLKESTFDMGSGEDERQFSFDISLPGSLSPGLHKGEVIFIQSSGGGEGDVLIGAELAVATQIFVHVPFPGKYLESELNIFGTEEKKTFVLVLVNRGEEVIEKASAEIGIVDAQGNEVASLESSEVSLKPGERKEVSAVWDVNVPIGRYIANVVLDYDGNKVLLKKEFEVGQFVLDLLQISVNDFSIGEVAKFNMIVENKWNEPISDAYAEMRVFDDEFNELANMKSATYSVPAGLRTTMVYYWDTKDIALGLYNANIILYYAGKKTQQDLKLDVDTDSITVIGLGYVISSEESGGDGGLVRILVIVIILLVLVNLLWFLVFRKRLKKKSNSRK